MNSPARTATSRLLAIALALLALAAPAWTHGGFDHIRGTVVSVDNGVLTVKTTTGNVAIKLDSRTRFTRNDRKAQLADLVPGARVIVEVPQTKDKDKVAQSVAIGAAPPAKK